MSQMNRILKMESSDGVLYVENKHHNIVKILKYLFVGKSVNLYILIK